MHILFVIWSNTCIHLPTCARMLSLSLSLSHTHTHTHKRAHAHTHTHTHRGMHMRTLAYTHRHRSTATCIGEANCFSFFFFCNDGFERLMKQVVCCFCIFLCTSSVCYCSLEVLLVSLVLLDSPLALSFSLNTHIVRSLHTHTHTRARSLACAHACTHVGVCLIVQFFLLQPGFFSFCKSSAELDLFLPNFFFPFLFSFYFEHTRTT